MYCIWMSSGAPSRHGPARARGELAIHGDEAAAGPGGTCRGRPAHVRTTSFSSRPSPHTWPHRPWPSWRRAAGGHGDALRPHSPGASLGPHGSRGGGDRDALVPAGARDARGQWFAHRCQRRGARSPLVPLAAALVVVVPLTVSVSCDVRPHVVCTGKLKKGVKRSDIFYNQ